VADKLTKLTKIASKHYECFTKIEVLRELVRFSPEELKELLEMDCSA
jgi:hypothetical protein